MPSPQLAKVNYEDLPDDLKRAHDHSMSVRGDATFFEVFAHHPTLYRWYTQRFYDDVFRGGLVDRRIKELARLRLSVAHGCRFCNQGNRLDAIDAGLSEAEVDAVIDSSLDAFSERERAVIRLADEMTLTNLHGTLRKEHYKQLRAYFSDAEILELGLVMGILSGMAKFLFAYDLVEKEMNCPIGHS